jgi:hypothetical protein
MLGGLSEVSAISEIASFPVSAPQSKVKKLDSFARAKTTNLINWLA